jgi:L-alanine-DL-glutamate epimerase-like enolase superfamily enzyme
MTYDQVADLPLVVDNLSLDRRERDTSSGFTRATTVVSLSGDGVTGRGEDVTYELDEHDPDRWGRVDLDLAGEYTLDSFSTALEDQSLFPSAPDREDFHHYRRWAFESAALELALGQGGETLGGRLGRQYDPVTFVASTRLSDADSDETPTADRVQEFLAVDPTLEFKLDPTPEWDDPLVEELAATGAVRTLDFKGHYSGTDVDTEPDPALYERLVTAFPDAVIEDPALTDAVEPILAGHEHRIAWDAPITGIESVEALPFDPDWLNIKPSRFGTVQRLLDTIDYCEEHGIEMYGGGQFELDVGRRQIQALASLYYPDAPNDVAPGGYNDPEPASELPTSPLDAPAVAAGFA